MLDSPDVEARANRVEGTRALVRLDCRVLVAEDSDLNQRLIRGILTKAGAEVTLAETGQQVIDLALAAMQEEPFDVILMDMDMPDLDGFEATRRLRDYGYRLPIIAFTAHAMSEYRDRCRAAGCDDFATKPIDRPVLLEKIARLARG